jgi:hypothetical protein
VRTSASACATPSPRRSDKDPAKRWVFVGYACNFLLLRQQFIYPSTFKESHMGLITPERAGEIRGQLVEQHGATWLHHYHEAIERETLEQIGFIDLCKQRSSAIRALHRIEDLAHNASTGPAVPDTLWEIRNIAQEAL